MQVGELVDHADMCALEAGPSHREWMREWMDRSMASAAWLEDLRIEALDHDLEVPVTWSSIQLGWGGPPPCRKAIDWLGQIHQPDHKAPKVAVESRGVEQTVTFVYDVTGHYSEQVSVRTLTRVRAHITEMTEQGWSLVSTEFLGNDVTNAPLMLFWRR